MNSREIVQRTLDYERPERVARSFGDSDLVWCGSSARTHATEWRRVDEGRWERTDEWGNLWSRVDPTSMGEVVKGVLQDLSDLSSCELPDYSRPEDYDCVRQKR